MGIYYIIPDDKKMVATKDVEKLKTAIFVHLFYEDQIEFYQEYLKRIPYFIDIVIISSSEVILNSFDDNNFKKIKKDNRGRDISALLIAARDIIFDYEYVCFIHDKKEKTQDTKEYVDWWIRNLWDNMLQSQTYIYNVLELLERDHELGMLVPLPPHGKDMGAWLKGAWGANYVNIKELANELGVRVNICYEKPPISYSTVFWAKSKVLKKLFLKDWEYADFPNEPMRNDGQLNHAIERILQYVVEDAGYETKIVLSTSFAAYFIEQLNREMNDLWSQLELTIGIRNYNGLDNYSSRAEKIKRFGKEYMSIYLYGAGKEGKDCLRMCRLLDIFPKGFIVTEVKDRNNKIEDIPLFSISDLVITKDMGIIISAGGRYQTEIEEELKKRKFMSYIFF